VKRLPGIAPRIAIGLATGLLTCVLAARPAAVNADAGTLAQANAALQAGEADRAMALIQSLPQNGQNNAEAQNVACRVKFTLGQWDAAIQACEQAIRLDPHNSGNHLWLGRALGEKADKASFVSAFSLGKRVLAEFQTAVQLDPRSGEALSDLGQFYIEAPGIIGGGMDKAESVAEQLDHTSPERAANLRAEMARHRGDYAAAENYLKKALASSSHPARQWSTLARFYADRARWADMDSAIHNSQVAAARDAHAAVALYDAAGVLIRVNRNPELAAKLLQDYLASPGKTEEAPAFVAYARLSRLQQQMGNAANAQVAQAAAYELAREYRPAQDLRR
jgi:tetratricopeptide (TPR) repeat protein